jgi:DNA ligase (NAD+)
VRIKRAGDVIPQVDAVVKPGEPRSEQVTAPERCPVCRSRVVSEGAYHKCPNRLGCPAQIHGSIRHYASRTALDIEGLGEKTVATFLEKKLITDVSSIYTLSVEQISQLAGFAELSASNLVAAIANSRTPPVDRFVYALGIPNVGEKTATDIAAWFGGFEAIRSATMEQLLEVDGVGPTVAESILTFFNTPEIQQALDRLLRYVTPQTVAVERPASAVSGKTFVFTGSLEHFTRSEAEKRVEDLGAKTTSSVSRQTDYLVYGPGAGAKLEKARKLGIELLDEEQFLKLLGDAS